MENETTTPATATPEAAPAAVADKGVPSPKESIAAAMKRLGGEDVFEGPATEAEATQAAATDAPAARNYIIYSQP